MEEPRIDFIQELLDQSEQAEAQQRIEMDKLRADQLLAAVGVLEEQMAEVNKLADDEASLIEEYRSNELARLDKKRSWILFNLEGFMRSSGEKTIRLPHGILKLRKGRDRVAVAAMEEFLKSGGKLGLLRTIPESFSPDLQAIVDHIKRTGEVPQGVEFIPAEIRFSYTTKGGDDEQQSSESGASPE